MEQRQFDAMLEDWLARQRRQDGDRSREVLWAMDAGITDGTAGRAFVTRDEVLQLLHKALDHFFRRLIAALRDTPEQT